MISNDKQETMTSLILKLIFELSLSLSSTIIPFNKKKNMTWNHV